MRASARALRGDPVQPIADGHTTVDNGELPAALSAAEVVCVR